MPSFISRCPWAARPARSASKAASAAASPGSGSAAHEVENVGAEFAHKECPAASAA